MNNKKGVELLKETLEIILFAVVMGLLIFAVVRVYNITLGQELENAKNIINSVEAKINAIEVGESGKFTISGLKGWFLAGWSKSDIDKPDKCILDSCICICKGGKSGSDLGNDCEEKGFCRLFGVKEMEVKTNQELHVVLNNEIIRKEDRSKSFIPFQETQLLNLDVKKESELISVIFNADPLKAEDIPLPAGGV